LCITESSTKRHPLVFKLLSSSILATLSSPRILTRQLFIINLGLKLLSSTALIIARIERGHQDLYKQGTRLERGYIARILLIYKDDSIEDVAIVIIDIIIRETISSIKVYIQDTEFDLDKVDKLA
jgi:hypothetical protein